MPDLPQWLAFFPQLEQVYQQELGRSCVSDPEAFVNWAFHWREGRQSIEWIRDRIRESPEWQEKHSSGNPGGGGGGGGAPVVTDPPIIADPPPVVDPPPSPPSPIVPAMGGFVETATTMITRPRVDTGFVPRQRGPGIFPKPYGSWFVRITDESDGEILHAGYSYWSQLNNHVGAEHILAFAGSGEGRPLFFRIHKGSGKVEPMGPILDYRGTGEGWYFSTSRPATVYLTDGPRLRRVDLFSHEDEVVCDISGEYPGCIAWQAHSAADDNTHSFTVKRITNDGPYVALGAMVCRGGERRFYGVRDGFSFDECAIDQTGRWLVIKETQGNQLYNRIVDLGNRSERVIAQGGGALGHSDMGYGVMVGEDSYHPTPGALCLNDLGTGLASLEWHGTSWGVDEGGGRPGYYPPGMGHVSVRGPYALMSNASRLDLPRVNELVVVALDGKLTGRVIAPNMTNLGEYRDQDTDYANRPHAALDPTRQWASWTANAHGRRDLFAVQVGVGAVAG